MWGKKDEFKKQPSVTVPGPTLAIKKTCKIRVRFWSLFKYLWQLYDV